MCVHRPPLKIGLNVPSLRDQCPYACQSLIVFYVELPRDQGRWRQRHHRSIMTSWSAEHAWATSGKQAHPE
jgi:hypothetical protein